MTHVYILMYSASEWRFLDLGRFVNVLLLRIIIISKRIYCMQFSVPGIRIVNNCADREADFTSVCELQLDN